eukprot:TRINITY_DN4201_c0_g3_i1.p1 TRINITY_DN4201_c0_g3~~TRINITY_DN4201_c0_g3_i1.p1  ORF type:complete len:226 (-),score=51.33 TRINITY_DN4201_c0_g3_i1:31-708(-)
MLNFKESDDGTFWMSFNDFCLYFRKIYICRVFNIRQSSTPSSSSSPSPAPSPSAATSEDNDKLWNMVRYSSRWSVADGTAQGCPAFLKQTPPNVPQKNPHYALQVKEPSLVFLTLTQQVQSREYCRINLYVLDKNQRVVLQRDAADVVTGTEQLERVSIMKNSEIVGSGSAKYVNTREVSLEVQLQPEKVYTVFVSTFRPGEEANFVLTAYCRNNMIFVPYPPLQ